MRAEKERERFGALKDIWVAIVEMPKELRKLSLVYLFQWYALFVYWQYVSLSIAKSIYGTEDTKSALYEDATAWTGLVNGWYNIVTFCVAFGLVAFARKRGAKLVHCACLLLAAVGLAIVMIYCLLYYRGLGLVVRWRLDHHADKRLRATGAQQHPAAALQRC